MIFWSWVLGSQSCPTLCHPMDHNLPGSSVHGILQARILEWVVILFSKGSSQPRDRTQVSCIAGRFITVLATREALWRWNQIILPLLKILPWILLCTENKIQHLGWPKHPECFFHLISLVYPDHCHKLNWPHCSSSHMSLPILEAHTVPFAGYALLSNPHKTSHEFSLTLNGISSKYHLFCSPLLILHLAFFLVCTHTLRWLLTLSLSRLKICVCVIYPYLHEWSIAK